MPKRIFITGGTGYIGRKLIPHLVASGHDVTALVRAGSEKKITSPCRFLFGNALDGNSYIDGVDEQHMFVHLVGVPHPGPGKARQFVEIDLKAAQEAIRVAQARRAAHFVYVSVAHPAPVMKAYVAVREECEALLRKSDLCATIVRPWYVLGPGHRWPILLQPLYRAAEWFPALRSGAGRLGLVNLDEMVRSLIAILESPGNGLRIVEVPEIRKLATTGSLQLAQSSGRRSALAAVCARFSRVLGYRYSLTR